MEFLLLVGVCNLKPTMPGLQIRESRGHIVFLQV